MTIYRSLTRPHLGYGDLVYDRASNKLFYQSLESLQYSPVISITGAIRGKSSENHFQETGLETLKSRHWQRKLCLLPKLIKEKSPAYLFQLISENNTPYNTRSAQKVKSLFSRQKQTFSKITFSCSYNGVE